MRVIVTTNDVFAAKDNRWKVKQIFMRCNPVTGDWFPQLTLECISAPGDCGLVGRTEEYQWDKMQEFLDKEILIYLRTDPS